MCFVPLIHPAPGDPSDSLLSLQLIRGSRPGSRESNRHGDHETGDSLTFVAPQRMEICNECHPYGQLVRVSLDLVHLDSCIAREAERSL